MRGFQNIMTTVGIESMVGSREWFSQALALNNLQLYAFGQVRFENQGARLNWLLPLGFTEKDPLPELLDNLAMEAGLRGAKFMLASTRVDDCLFETLRRAGYCLYGWQSIWEISKSLGNTQVCNRWSGSNRTPGMHWNSLASSASSFRLPRNRSPLLRCKSCLILLLKIDGVIKGYARVSCFNNKVTDHSGSYEYCRECRDCSSRFGK